MTKRILGHALSLMTRAHDAYDVSSSKSKPYQFSSVTSLCTRFKTVVSRACYVHCLGLAITRHENWCAVHCSGIPRDSRHFPVCSHFCSHISNVIWCTAAWMAGKAQTARCCRWRWRALMIRLWSGHQTATWAWSAASLATSSRKCAKLMTLRLTASSSTLLTLSSHPVQIILFLVHSIRCFVKRQPTPMKVQFDLES